MMPVPMPPPKVRVAGLGPVVRAELDALDDDEIRRRLHAADPNTWRRIHANDRYRNQRALEICEVAGRPMSELAAAQHPQPALGLGLKAQQR